MIPSPVNLSTIPSNWVTHSAQRRVNSASTTRSRSGSSRSVRSIRPRRPRAPRLACAHPPPWPGRRFPNSGRGFSSHATRVAKAVTGRARRTARSADAGQIGSAAAAEPAARRVGRPARGTAVVCGAQTPPLLAKRSTRLAGQEHQRRESPRLVDLVGRWITANSLVAAWIGPSCRAFVLPISRESGT
jgi:hypothetical protein